jgi:hypothetical protein
MASTYINRTVTSAGNQKTFTISFWLKKSALNSSGYMLAYGTNNVAGDPRGYVGYSTDIIRIGFNPTGSSWTEYTIQDNGNNIIFRDVNAWYHIVVAVDTTQATASDRLKVYINGSQKSFASYPSQNFDTGFNSTRLHEIGSYPADRNNGYLNGCLAHYHFIDGTAYDASTFGETDATTGIWKPKTAPSVTYGTNGFFLKFENSGTMGTDSSPNGNNFTVNGSLTQTVDTPSNVFATFNPLIYMPNIPTFENGNLYVKGHDANYCEAISTLSMPKKGKWYAEFKKIEINNCFMVGIGNTNNIVEALRTNTNISPSGGGYSGGAVTIREAGDVRQTNVSDISGFFPSSIANTNIIGLAIDLDNGAVYAHKNGTYGVISSVTGDPTSGASKTGAIDISGQAWYQNADFICFLFGNISSATKDWCQANFGNGYFGTTPVASAGLNGNGAIFEYDVPTGYYALNTKNINTYG